MASLPPITQEVRVKMTGDPLPPKAVPAPVWLVRLILFAFTIAGALGWVNPGNTLPTGAATVIASAVVFIAGAFLFMGHEAILLFHQYGFSIATLKRIFTAEEAEIKTVWPDVRAYLDEVKEVAKQAHAVPGSSASLPLTGTVTNNAVITYASGGVITTPTIAVLADDGPEAVVPLSISDPIPEVVAVVPEVVAVVKKCYGRLAAVVPLGLAMLAEYLKDPLPAAPIAMTPPTVDPWGMLGNDSVGDCTLAAVAHLRMACATDHAEPVPAFTDSEVTTEYFTLTGGPDTGLVESSVLKTWQTAGLFGNKIVGWAPVNHRNLAEIKSVCAVFGGVYLGVSVPKSAEDQFDNGQAWSVVKHSPIEGGHAVPMVGFDDTYAYIVTWGKLWPVEWAWLTRYLEEAYVVLTSEDAAGVPSVDLETLQADLAAVK